MTRQCSSCPQMPFNLDKRFSDFQITYWTWKSIKGADGNYRMRFTKSVHTAAAFCDNFEFLTKSFMKYEFSNFNQYQSVKAFQANLSQNDAMLTIDWSQNWNVKYAVEPQAMHFGDNRGQISLHTGCAENQKNLKQFATTSDFLNHTPDAIWSHLNPVLTWIKTCFPTAIRNSF